MFHSQQHPSSMSTPLSFADLLCASASDVIDWAPPGRVTTWNSQIQTATRRSDDDRAEARLRHSARSNGSGSQLDTTASNNNINTTTAPTTTTGGSSSGGDVVAGAPAPGGTGWQQMPWWSRGLMHGLFGAQSHVGLKLHDSDTLLWSAEATTALSVSGHPLSFDAGWRANTHVTWVPRRWRLLLQGQWATPLDLAPDVVHVQLRTPRHDVAFRADRHLYLLSQCANWSSSRQEEEPQSPQLSSSMVLGNRPQQPQARATMAANSGTVSTEATSGYIGAWGILRQYVASVRGGIGLAIKNDLTSGINLFTGVAVKTAGGLTASYHVDVLRRLTLSVSQRSVIPAQWEAPLGVEDGQHAIVTALRLKLNTITYQGTALDIGVDLPLAVVLGLLHPRRSSADAVAAASVGATASGQLHPAIDCHHPNAASSATGPHASLVGEALAFLQRHPISVHCSHSSVGSMIGVRWKDAQKVLPKRLLPLIGDVRVDLTAGVVAKRLAVTGLPPLSSCNTTVADGSICDANSTSTHTGSSPLLGGRGSSGVPAGATAGAPCVGDSARFASARSTLLGTDGAMDDDYAEIRRPPPTQLGGDDALIPCPATRPPSIVTQLRNNLALSSFLLVSFE